jgi:hypothetical protein
VEEFIVLKYRMKSIVCDAFRVTYDLLREKHGRVENNLRYYSTYVVVPVKAGQHTNVADVGDWIVKLGSLRDYGVFGYDYIIYSDEDFLKHFELVEDFEEVEK